MLLQCRRDDDLEPFKRLKAIRYALFRMKNEEDGGCKAGRELAKIAKPYAKRDGFTGFSDFAKKWDVDPLDPDTIIMRDKSVWQAHNEYMIKVAKPLPGHA